MMVITLIEKVYSVDSNRNLFHNPYKISSNPSFPGDGKIVE